MIDKNDLLQVKKSLQQNIGRTVRLTSKRGRKKVVVRKGVIESIYPCIFTVKLDNIIDENGEKRRVSFSYADVLTKNVELALIRQTAETPAVTA